MFARISWLLLVIAGLAPAGVLAQTPAPSAPATEGLAPAQAEQALAVLRDDKRRAELIATLEAIAKAGAQTDPKAGAKTGAKTGAAGGQAPAAGPSEPVASTPGAPTVAPTAAPTTQPAPAPAIPLEPDSLGAQFVLQVSAAASTAGTQLMTSLRQVNDLPLLWRWLYAQAHDPAALARLGDAAWKLLAVAAASLVTERGARLVLRRLHGAVSRGAQSGPAPPAVPNPGEDAAAAETLETEHTARRRRLAGTIAALRRLPFLFGRLLLDLVPIALFAFVSHALLGTPLGEPSVNRLVIVAVVESYVAVRVIGVVTRMLFSPKGLQLRLFPVSDWAAQFMTRWVRRISVIGIAGYTMSEVGLLFGMYRTASDALLKLFALVLHVALVVAVLQARVPVARRLRARPGRTGAWPMALNGLADIWHVLAIFYIMALWFVWAIELRNGYLRLINFFTYTVGVLIVCRLAAVVLLGGLERLRAGSGLAARHPGIESRIGIYLPFARLLVMTVIGVATAMALLQVWGFGVIGWFQYTGLGGRAASAAVTIGVTIVLAALLWEGVNGGIELHLARLTDGEGRADQRAKAGRLRTLLPMLRTVLLMTILLVVGLMTLSELGVNIAPLLAGAGVIGIAVGFGSQKLVQDLITGLFLLLENTMQVGDVVTLGGLSGTVEALSIRTIRLRAQDGSVHMIPFSAVTTVTNQTRDYSYAVVDVNLGLNEEPERIVDVLKTLAEEMRADPHWSSIVLQPLEVLGVERFVDLAWIMRIRMKTQPSSRWAVVRELNRRIKERFDEMKIESPFTSHRALGVDPPPPRPVIAGQAA